MHVKYKPTPLTSMTPPFVMSDKGAKKTSNAIKKSLSKCLNILLILLNPLKPLFVQFPVPIHITAASWSIAHPYHFVIWPSTHPSTAQDYQI